MQCAHAKVRLTEGEAEGRQCSVCAGGQAASMRVSAQPSFLGREV